MKLQTYFNNIVKKYLLKDNRLKNNSLKKNTLKKVTLKKNALNNIRQNSLQVKTSELEQRLCIKKREDSDVVIALAGNPNVGKSTVFNYFTGLNQHTGNWPGKTVANAQGYCDFMGKGYVFVDIPGCYSLMAHSTEEEVARDFICFENPDVVIVVCDATCLERNLNLVLQILEVTKQVVVCINLMDEAKKKGITVDLEELEHRLFVPVVGTSARNKEGLDTILIRTNELLEERKLKKLPRCHYMLRYPQYIESLLDEIEALVVKAFPNYPNMRWLSARLLDADESLLKALHSYIEINEKEYERLKELLRNIDQEFAHVLRSQKELESTLEYTSNKDNKFEHSVMVDTHASRTETDLEFGDKLESKKDQKFEHSVKSKKQLKDDIAASFVKMAEEISKACIHHKFKEYSKRDRKLDRLFTSKITGFPIMFLMLLGIFWLTITGANYPSKLLSGGLFWIEDRLLQFFIWMKVPKLLYEMLVLGVYRVLAWVVSVMLPPMAIFFPLFTLLEDFGFLPRVAFNLDRCFKRCSACGKQALTMCMGFGCNAAGVIGCRIIDSKRERLIAIITNNFVPCNGRFPTLITIISMFFVGTTFGWYSSILSAAILSLVIMLGIVMTLLVSKLLSKTLLKGIPSSFTLELPPYRRPQIAKVIVRSIFDRTLFVLSRAIVIAMPAGLVIWGMANITVADGSLLYHCSNFLDPYGRFLGMDGVILLAFILGFPANEIVLPIIIMTYLAKGSLLEIDDLNVLRNLLVDNGWTAVTAISTMLFSLMHWPCSTTCLTIRKETQSRKWTLVSFFTPTIIGMVVCGLFANLARLFL